METMLYFIPILICDVILLYTSWQDEDRDNFVTLLVVHFIGFFLFSLACLAMGITKIVS